MSELEIGVGNVGPLKRQIATLQESNTLLLEACKRVLDSPFEPDKWRINVQAAIAKADQTLSIPRGGA
jgi:hypothetical protein